MLKQILLLLLASLRSRRQLAMENLALRHQQVVDTIGLLGIDQIITASRSPWQNGYCERVIGTITREISSIWLESRSSTRP